MGRPPAFGQTMTPQANEPESFPPISPEGETVVSESPSFLATCLSHSNQMVQSGGWVLGTQLFTRSDKWGMIWRVDFKIPSEDVSPMVNRIICWQEPNERVNVMFAIGQDVPPLRSRS
jgi:hypothetical protein